MRLSLRSIPLVLASCSLASLALFATRGETVPLYAARQGVMCAQCHFDPNGGGPRNAYGFTFEKNRHSTDAETGGMFKDLDLSNRVGETMPIYFGVDHRLMILADDVANPPSGVDRFGFYNMESNLSIAFQPHEKLTLVYTTDGLNGPNIASNSPRVTREAWGMLGIGSSHYVKVGQFRLPFGLRLDDHTVGSRNGFLDFQTRQSVLPFDPRLTDQGVEFGGNMNSTFGRIALTNGASNVLQGLNKTRTRADAVSAKLGYNRPAFQAGVSGYDEWQPVFAGGDKARIDRWGLYGLTHFERWSFLGELVSGTDKIDGATGAKSAKNVLGAFAEADMQWNRALNFRVRFDHMETDRNADLTLRELGSFSRYALEGEIVPVPFAEIRWTLRLIDPSAPKTPAGGDNEKQAYIQLHFAY
jgi:hypothetical protein